MDTSFKKWAIVAICCLSGIDLLFDGTAYLDRVTNIDIEYEYPHVAPTELAAIKRRITLYIILITSCCITFQVFGVFAVLRRSVRLTKLFAVVSLFFGVLAGIGACIEAVYWIFAILSIVNGILGLFYVKDLLVREEELMMNLIEL